MMTKLCEQVIHESIFTFCQACAGKKELQAGERVIVCDTCGGTGLHRHTDRDRAKALGLSEEAYGKGWNKRLAIVQAVFSANYRAALRTAKDKFNED